MLHLYTTLEQRRILHTSMLHLYTTLEQRPILHTSMLHLYSTLELSSRSYTFSCYICTLHWNWVAVSTHFHAATSRHYTVSEQSVLHIYSVLFLQNIFLINILNQITLFSVHGRIETISNFDRNVPSQLQQQIYKSNSSWVSFLKFLVAIPFSPWKSLFIKAFYIRFHSTFSCDFTITGWFLFNPMCYCTTNLYNKVA
jgi:hypothetical protein